MALLENLCLAVNRLRCATCQRRSSVNKLIERSKADTSWERTGRPEDCRTCVASVALLDFDGGVDQGAGRTGSSHCSPPAKDKCVSDVARDSCSLPTDGKSTLELQVMVTPSFKEDDRRHPASISARRLLCGSCARSQWACCHLGRTSVSTGWAHRWRLRPSSLLGPACSHRKLRQRIFSSLGTRNIFD